MNYNFKYLFFIQSAICFMCSLTMKFCWTILYIFISFAHFSIFFIDSLIHFFLQIFLLPIAYKLHELDILSSILFFLVYQCCVLLSKNFKFNVGGFLNLPLCASNFLSVGTESSSYPKSIQRTLLFISFGF